MPQSVYMMESNCVCLVKIRKADLNSIPRRDDFMSIPKKLGPPANLVVRHIMCVYGTRDSGMLWEDWSLALHPHVAFITLPVALVLSSMGRLRMYGI